jgi:4-hydroxyphenylpyruvate dioxygenase-like putative hemolysin
MIVKFGHVLVDDQDKALRFYTETLGFVKKRDVPDGESGMRFLTVESQDGIVGFELELQETHTAAARTYQQEFRAAGFAYVAFSTNDIYAEYRRLKERGVTFFGEPEDAGPVWTVKFDDTCGNLINLLQSRP